MRREGPLVPGDTLGVGYWAGKLLLTEKEPEQCPGDRDVSHPRAGIAAGTAG